MGACASKPKVLKTDMDAVPEPTISKEVKTTSPAVETREIVVDDKNKVDQVQEEEETIPKVDDDADKRQSLGVLLQETQGKDSSSDDKTQIETAQAEPVKEVVPTAVEIVEIRTEDTTPVPAVVTSETVKTQNPDEVIPAVESEKLEKSEEKGTTEEKVLTTPKADIEKPIQVAPVVQSVKAVQTETKPVVESVKADQVEKAETTAVAATVVVAPPVVATTEKTVEAAPPVVAATEKTTVQVAPTKADVVEEKKTEIAPATEKTIEVAPPVETAKIGPEVVVKEADKVSTIQVRPEESVSSVSSAGKVAGEVS